MTHGQGGGDSRQPYALELHIRGVMHLQIERLPPKITTVLTAVASSLITWLTAHGLHW
jgi:hypothetical protein